jgi:hypothetical protein
MVSSAPPRASLSHEEPEAGNLHIRVCERVSADHDHLGTKVQEALGGFTIRQFSVMVGLVPAVYAAFAEAWRAAGLPE